MILTVAIFLADPREFLVVSLTTNVSLVIVLGFLPFPKDLLKLQRKMHISGNGERAQSNSGVKSNARYLQTVLNATPSILLLGLYAKKQPAMDVSVTLPGDI